jgi:hypothetical protein
MTGFPEGFPRDRKAHRICRDRRLEGKVLMARDEDVDLDPPDHACEGCGRARPRLSFDEVSRALLCQSCLDRVQHLQSWSLLREADNV